jgi:hypothetical protein
MNSRFDRYGVYEVSSDDSLFFRCSCRDIHAAQRKLQELSDETGKDYWAVEIETGKKILKSYRADRTTKAGK